MPDLDVRLVRALADRYRLERQLGQGGMAIVYLAEDIRHHRDVAVKVLRPELGAALGGERFLREIQIAARLRHPHILPLYDSGEADGFLYYVMPVVEGESLRDRLTREKQLPIEDALRYAREVADALSYAHAHGVVHRDIKPENILLESEHAVVADFGIAKAVEAAAGSRTSLTDTGVTIGTPAYMSPEQAAGEHDVDGRSDLYSLGCVLYEMLAGHPPFRGATTESLVRQHVMTTPPPVTQFRPAVSAQVNDALMRALAKAPADRFNPVGQFSAALGLATTTATIVAPTPPARPAATRHATRWLAAGAIGLALLALGATWAVVARNRTTPVSTASDRSIAVLPFDNLGGDTSIVPLILGIHAEMITQLTKLGELTVTSRSSALEYRNSTKTERTIASELGVQSLLTGSVQRSGDQVRVSVALSDASRGKELWAESYDRPYTTAGLFAIQGDIARQVATALRVRLSDQQQQQIARAPTTNLAALDAYYRGLALWDIRGPAGDDTLIVNHLERAVALDPSFVAAWSLLAQARAWLLRRYLVHDTLPAWIAVQRAQALAPGSLEATLAAGYYRYYARGDFSGALDQLSAADRLMPNSSEILLAMALLERRQGRWDAAVPLLERVIRLDPRNTVAHVELASTFCYMRLFGEGARSYDRALAIQPHLPTAIIRRFPQLVAMGDTAAARTLLRQEGTYLPPRVQAYWAGYVAFLVRDYPGALAAYRHTAGWDGGWHRNLQSAVVAAASGDSVLARRHADSLVRAARAELAEQPGQGTSDPFGRRTYIEAQMALGLAIRGEREAAVRLAEAADRRYGIKQDAIDGQPETIVLAETYMLVGRRADAVAILERLLAVPSNMTVRRLRLDPTWDSLRGEPEFQRLIATTP